MIAQSPEFAEKPYRIASNWRLGALGGVVSGHIDQAGRSYVINNKWGMQEGFFGEYIFSENLALRVELLFERRAFGMYSYYNGIKLKDTSSYVCWNCYLENSIVYTSDYVHLPVLIHFSKHGHWFDYGAEAGLFFSLLAQAVHQGFEEVYLDPQQARPFIAAGFEPGLTRIVYNGPVKDVISTHDAGLVIGIRAGRQLFGGLSASLNARLQLGLAGVFENPQMPLFNYSGYMLRFELFYPLLLRP